MFYVEKEAICSSQDSNVTELSSPCSFNDDVLRETIG